MKAIIITISIACGLLQVTAQSQLDTFKLYKEKVPSAWSQQPDTVRNNQQPISSQPVDNTPVPPPLTNPIDNPTSGQTHEPANTAPLDMPAVQPRGKTPVKRKPVAPVKIKSKPSDYDTVPGTKRNG